MTGLPMSGAFPGLKGKWPRGWRKEGGFPSFDEKLRRAMKKEAELFFSTVIKEDRSILELLDSDYTYVNERLAKHYGIPNVKGEDFKRVSLAGTHRGGVLTMASVLT